MSKTTIGIDPGTKTTGWCVLRDGRYHASGVITAKGTKLGKRLAQIRDGLQAVLSQYLPSAVVVEDVPKCKSMETYYSIGNAAGVILLTCEDYHILVEKVAVQTWKSAFLGKGNASKPEVHAMAETIEPGLSDERDAKGIHKDQDRADAIGIIVGWSAMEGTR